jgi:hypothetical protein
MIHNIFPDYKSGDHDVSLDEVHREKKGNLITKYNYSMT